MVFADWTPDVRILDRNGATAPHQERPNPLRRQRWVDLGDLYPGHQILIWFNPGKRRLEPLPGDASADDKFRAGLKLMVLAHRVHFDDGTPDSPWIDPETDQPMPSPATNEFWEAISNEQLEIIAGHIVAEEKKVRASVARIFGGSTDTLSAGTLPSATGPDGSAGTTSDATSPSAGTATPEP